MSCIFCQIVARTSPASIICQDDRAIGEDEHARLLRVCGDRYEEREQGEESLHGIQEQGRRLLASANLLRGLGRG